MSNFSENLSFGRIAESQIATWLRFRCKWSLMPAYEKEIDDHKGPRLFTPDEELVTPDFLAVRGAEIRWIEAKHKTVFSWYRIGGYWVTGIDCHHYDQYQRVAAEFKWPIWLLFLHIESKPWPVDVSFGCPPVCPTGLFCGELLDLSAKVSHRSYKHGKHGMVYWPHSALRLIATMDEVRSVSVNSKVNEVSVQS